MATPLVQASCPMPTETLFIIARLIGFAVLWLAALFLISHVGGWAKLAQAYPDADPTLSAQGKNYYCRSGAIGPVGYGSCLQIRVCKAGLRLSMLFPFRIGHPPLFIPWDAFHTITMRRGLFTCYVEACIGWPVIAEVVLPIWVIDHLPADPMSQ